jgi:hypothetical protein
MSIDRNASSAKVGMLFVAAAMRSRCGSANHGTSGPMARINTDRIDGAALGWIERKAWDAEADYYLQMLGRPLVFGPAGPLPAAALPAGLRLRIAGGDAGGAQRGRANPLAVLVLCRTI